MRIWLMALFMLAAGLLVACASEARPTATPMPITLVPAEQRPTSTFTDPVLRRGEANFNLLCAHCHGYNLEGQVEAMVETTLSLGMNLVPALDSTGHAWQHPDQLLTRVIEEGIQNPLDQYAMVGFSDGLTDEDVESLIAYMKLFWTEEQRAQQREVTRRWAEIDAQMQVSGE